MHAKPVADQQERCHISGTPNPEDETRLPPCWNHSLNPWHVKVARAGARQAFLFYSDWVSLDRDRDHLTAGRTVSGTGGGRHPRNTDLSSAAGTFSLAILGPAGL